MLCKTWKTGANFMYFQVFTDLTLFIKFITYSFVINHQPSHYCLFQICTIYQAHSLDLFSEYKVYLIQTITKNELRFHSKVSLLPDFLVTS